MAVVTNGDGDAQQATVDRIGLRPLLDAVVVSETVGICKPDPQIFALAGARCERSLRGAWMIGDSEVDVVGAAHSGARSVWLARGRAWQRDDVFPDAVAADLPTALLGIAASEGMGASRSRHHVSPPHRVGRFTL